MPSLTMRLILNRDVIVWWYAGMHRRVHSLGVVIGLVKSSTLKFVRL